MQLGLFLCLAAVPILEIVLLVKLGQWIGFWLTVAIVIGTALLVATRSYPLQCGQVRPTIAV